MVQKLVFQLTISQCPVLWFSWLKLQYRINQMRAGRCSLQDLVEFPPKSELCGCVTDLYPSKSSIFCVRRDISSGYPAVFLNLWQWQTLLSLPVVSNLSGTRDCFHRRQFFHGLRREGMVWAWSKSITFIVYFISIIVKLWYIMK